MYQPTPWPLLERLAGLHAGPATADHDARVSNPILRAKFACQYRDDHRASYDGGALGEPCVRCGTFTHCFCETCFVVPRNPPFAVCTVCDGDELVCMACDTSGLEWADGPKAREERGDPPEGVIEVSAFQNDLGETVNIDPPLLLPITELDNLQIHIRRYCAEHGM